ncbi:MAG: class I SAM-dependent methyltransferase [gamma proteobacterium symbiont of Lucinoma myriamae]|nr:class I SAM-dependent methyltransferase [gamma proteobacterium symbiont of Lucinoma myriamae]MCU7833204.1 class I SAM-dependent methyltransferase [gamma proteobacterium symbiont of Lucinoma myriamae]
MKISGGEKEDGIVIGNTYDKYGSQNPVVQWLMNGFNNSLSDLIAKAAPKTVHEIGCGEGYWVIRWNHQGIDARGSDFSSQVIELARENALADKLSPNTFQQLSIYDVNSDNDSAELIVCCEVLEHLEFPEKGLQALQHIVKQYVILSVPREPIWRALNIMRGKYLSKLGNTPGHVQHWTHSSFMKLVTKYFDIIEIKTPLPWTMVLCQIRDKQE